MLNVIGDHTYQSHPHRPIPFELLTGVFVFILPLSGRFVEVNPWVRLKAARQRRVGWHTEKGEGRELEASIAALELYVYV